MLTKSFQSLRDSWKSHGLSPMRLLCPWNSPGKNTGVGCHALLQGILSTERSNPHLLCLLHCQVGPFLLTQAWEAQIILYICNTELIVNVHKLLWALTGYSWQETYFFLPFKNVVFHFPEMNFACMLFLALDLELVSRMW